MINVAIKEQEDVLEINLKGHANAFNYGKDIICASVSTAVIMTVNLIELLELNNHIIDLVVEEGYFRLVIKKDNEVLKGVFNNFEYTLNDISKQYPKYIKIKK